MTSKQKFNASMVWFGVFILIIYAGIDVFIYLYASKAIAVLVFILGFPSRQRKEVWEDMQIFMSGCRE